MNDNAIRWTLDQHECLNLRLRDLCDHPVHVWIMPRQHYCDRGHWQLSVDAPGLDLDYQDGFPRFFMTLETAIMEAESWLRWRLYKRTETPMFKHMLRNYDGRRALVGFVTHD